MPVTGINRFESVTVTHTTAIGMTTTVGNGILPRCAVITVEGAAIRFRIDGTDPTASVGHVAESGDVIELPDREQVERFKAIRRDGIDATLRVTQGINYLP